MQPVFCFFFLWHLGNTHLTLLPEKPWSKSTTAIPFAYVKSSNDGYSSKIIYANLWYGILTMRFHLCRKPFSEHFMMQNLNPGLHVDGKSQRETALTSFFKLQVIITGLCTSMFCHRKSKQQTRCPERQNHLPQSAEESAPGAANRGGPIRELQLPPLQGHSRVL